MNINQENNNIVLNQIQFGQIKEVKPTFNNKIFPLVLTLDQNNKLCWTSSINNINNIGGGKDLSPGVLNGTLQLRTLKAGENIAISFEESGAIRIDASFNVPSIEIPKFILFEDNKLQGTSLYYIDGKFGVGTKPRMNYKFDIAIPKDTLTTAFHIGDGSFGFSMGNGTTQGFIPQIIGMGAYENDAGLYFVGRSGNDELSNIPLIILDGRRRDDSALKLRPILGVTSGAYDEYKFIVDAIGRVGINRIPQTSAKLEVGGGVLAQSYDTISKREFKTDLNYNIDSTIIYDLKPVQFRYKEPYTPELHYGFIAEEVYDVCKELTSVYHNKPYSVKTFEIVPLLIAEIQKLNNRIEQLEQKDMPIG